LPLRNPVRVVLDDLDLGEVLLQHRYASVLRSVVHHDDLEGDILDGPIDGLEAAAQEVFRVPVDDDNREVHLNLFCPAIEFAQLCVLEEFVYGVGDGEDETLSPVKETEPQDVVLKEGELRPQYRFPYRGPPALGKRLLAPRVE